MNRRPRIAFALLGGLLSVPAFFAIFAGFVFVVMLSDYRGFLTEALWEFVSGGTWTSLRAILVLLCLVLHVFAFLYMLLQFARAKTPPAFLQAYCLLVIIGATFELIRLHAIGDEHGANFWFGLISLPHALVLLALILLNHRLAHKLLAAV